MTEKLMSEARQAPYNTFNPDSSMSDCQIDETNSIQAQKTIRNVKACFTVKEERTLDAQEQPSSNGATIDSQGTSEVTVLKVMRTNTTELSLSEVPHI